MAAVSTMVGVLLASAVLRWALYLLGKHMDRADRDTRYHAFVGYLFVAQSVS